MARQESWGKLIKQISDVMRKNANNAMRSQDMTISQMVALLELEETPEKQRSLKELEQCLHVAQSTAAGIVSRLEQKGFVKTLGDAEDRRVKLVQITPAGRMHVADAKKDMSQAEQKLLSALTDAERDIFYVLLQKVCRSLS